MLNASPRDRTPRLRPHLAQPFRLAIELSENLLGTEVVDDRASERRPDPWHSGPQPKGDSFARLRQRRAKRLDRKLGSVPRMLRKLSYADELLARGHMTERPRKRHPIALATFAERRHPDSKLQVGRHVARPGPRERDAYLASVRARRQRSDIELPHAADHTPDRPARPGASSWAEVDRVDRSRIGPLGRLAARSQQPCGSADAQVAHSTGPF